EGLSSHNRAVAKAVACFGPVSLSPSEVLLSMLTTMTLFAALSLAPAQTGELELTNIRPTYGLMGPARPDNKLLPGDFFFVSYDIENIKVDGKTGKVLYSMGMECVDSKGKTQYKQEPRDLESVNSLGGSRLP